MKPAFRIVASAALPLALTCPAFAQAPAVAVAQGPTAPAVAAAVGYNENTFSTEVFSTANVDLTGSFKSGFQWYLYNFFGLTPTAANITIGSDQSISVGQGGDNWNGTISSAASIGTCPYYVGTAFGGGAYIEATVKFNAHSDSTTSGWPAFWTNALEGNLGTSQWPGQATGYHHSIEADILEYFQGQWSDPLNQYSAGLHDWYGLSSSASQYSTGASYTVPQIDFSTYNVVAMLWVPATSTTKGYIKFYWNGNLVSNTQYTQLTPADLPPPSASTPWAFGIIDQDHLVIQAGSNNTYPIIIKSVTVWQANANSNLHN